MGFVDLLESLLVAVDEGWLTKQEAVVIYKNAIIMAFNED